MPCLIKKGSRCVADRTSKTTFFIFLLLYSTKILQENHVYLFVIWLVQWWKLYCIYIFFTQRTIDFHRLKRNMNDGTIVFLTSLLIALTWNILLLFSFWHKIISCFKLKSLAQLFLKNVLTLIFEIMKKENNTNTSSFDTFIRC